MANNNEKNENAKNKKKPKYKLQVMDIITIVFTAIILGNMANIKQIIHGDNKFQQSGAIIQFTDSELVTLSNALYEYLKENGTNEYKDNLRDIVFIASQISQYGHMDNFAVSTLSYVVKNKKESE